MILTFLHQFANLYYFQHFVLRQPTPDPVALPLHGTVIDLTGSSIVTLPAPHKAKTRAPRSNWADPTRWILIAAVVKYIGFKSPQGIVNERKKGTAGAVFKSLNRGTVGAWIKPDHSGWTQETLDRVARAAAVNTAHEAPRVAREGVKLGRPALLVSTDTHIPN